MKSLEPTEEQEQIVVAEWLDLHGILYSAIPHGEVRPSRLNSKGQRYCLSGQRLAKTGVKAGLCDLLIFDPPRFIVTYNNEGYSTVPASLVPFVDIEHHVGTAIEMKRKKGGKVSPEQQKWLDELADRGWATRVCRGADEAIAFLKSLGYARRG